MKKTIAKIMAAAMVLSAVPAVALPTLTAEAAENADAVTISGVKSATQTLDEDGKTGVTIKGYKNSTKVVLGTVSHKAETDTDTYDITFTFSSNDDGITVGTEKKYLADYVNASINSSDQLVLSVASSDNAAKALVAAVEAQKNTVKVTAAYGTQISTNVNTDATTTITDLGSYKIGGVVDSANSTLIKTGIRAGGSNNTAKLHDGDVYAEISNSTALEVKILRGDKSDLDDNDDLRGQTLDLTTVKIGGVSYKVTQIGAQVLKKAHMKKFYAENAKKIGKGALRSAKQVKKVDIEDGQKVRKIHETAFYSCKNLNTIVIDGRKLNTVGKNAFNGVKKNCTVKIKAKKSKFESDKKMILKNGGNKNLKFVRK